MSHKDPKIPTTLLGLLEHFSPSGKENAAVEWLVWRIQTLGYTRAFIDTAGNAVGIMGRGKRQLVLLGHIDTVPGEITVRLENGRLYGRGSVDAKGPLGAFVDAVASLGECEGWELVVIGAVGEEADSPGARYAVNEYHPEYALIGEPSGWQRLTLGYKGSASSELTCRVKNTHNAGKEANACEQAFAVWSRVLDWARGFNEQRTRQFEQLTPSLVSFASGNTGFESWASLGVSARLPLDFSPDEWYQQISAISQPAEVDKKGFAVSAYRAQKTNPLNAAFLASIRQVGGAPGFLLKTGTSDMNIVGPAWDCPIAAYGPGDSSLDHTPDEHVHLEDYAHGVEVLQKVIARLTHL